MPTTSSTENTCVVRRRRASGTISYSVRRCVEQNRLGHLREQIDDRCAARARIVRGESPALEQPAPLAALELPDEKDDLRFLAESRRPHASKTARSKKRNFCGNVKYSCSSR